MDQFYRWVWEQENGWEIPSLVWAGLDAGLGPIEVNVANLACVFGHCLSSAASILLGYRDEQMIAFPTLSKGEIVSGIDSAQGVRVLSCMGAIDLPNFCQKHPDRYRGWSTHSGGIQRTLVITSESY